MINAWSLLYDEIYGDDEMSPCKTDHKHDDDIVITTVGSGNTASADTNVFAVDTSNFDKVSINTSESDDFITITGGENTVYDFSDVDFTVPPYEEPVVSSVNLDDITFIDTPTPGIQTDNPRKYKEDESIKALQDYISTTYCGHYTSDNNNVQTLDLMAARSVASGFCQANILKYGSRYGSKDGKNKKDLMKVIHYAMLLLHFDEHYGKPSMTSGNIDHNMP